jgi:DnaK suppressor protein
VADRRHDPQWVAGRRADLLARSMPSEEGWTAASSGCAESGAQRLAQARAEDADAALARLDAGLLGQCTACGGEIAWERLDAVVTAVRCVTC